MDLAIDATCPDCNGHEMVIPAFLDKAVVRLTEIMESGPAADLSLDQSHCTAETKVRRVLALFRAGVLPGGSLLLIGDDDLVSLVLLVVGDILGSPLVTRLGVVDISAQILNYIRDFASRSGVTVDAVRHDLREPLPDQLRGQFDAAMTDPPYTVEGARLFLGRAVEGLRPGAGYSIFFSFGAKSPNEMFEVQQEIIQLGLVTHSLVRNFNEYCGSGILGGTSSMQQLLTTDVTTSSVGAARHEGPLYTRDKRSRQREYSCIACGAVWAVGHGAQWNSVGALREQGCPTCGGGPFKPGRLITRAPKETLQVPAGAFAASDEAPSASLAAEAGDGYVRTVPGRVNGSRRERQADDETLRELALKAAPYTVRPAKERDLDVLAAFEVDIARKSFGEDAVDDPKRHRARLARAMVKSRLGMFVACGPGDDGDVVGWLWMSTNQNAMTGTWFANFRSLATAPVEQRSEVAELLIATGLRFADDQGLGEVVGKVYSGNLEMRTLYRRFGFTSTHLKMQLKFPTTKPL